MSHTYLLPFYKVPNIIFQTPPNSWIVWYLNCVPIKLFKMQEYVKEHIRWNESLLSPSFVVYDLRSWVCVVGVSLGGGRVLAPLCEAGLVCILGDLCVSRAVFTFEDTAELGGILYIHLYFAWYSLSYKNAQSRQRKHKAQSLLFISLQSKARFISNFFFFLIESHAGPLLPPLS